MKDIAQTAASRECQAITNAVQGKESVSEYVRRRTLVLLRGLVRRYRHAVKARDGGPQAPMLAKNAGAIQAGDLVRVRNLDEINLTLDNRGYSKGCKFMAQMEAYCGEQYRVAGKVEKFFDEARCRTLNCKDLLLLDQVYCDGTVVGGCDRMCFLFWRAEWLEKLD